MGKQLKSRSLRKNQSKYVYVLPEKGVLYTARGDWIICAEQEKYVCGGCFQLLRILGVRSWSLSPSPETLLMHHSQTDLFASSKCGCEINSLMRSLSLFQSFPQEEESIFMGFSLTCRCISEIHAMVDAQFSTVPNAKPEFSLPYGERVLWMQEKLTVLQDWRITYRNT